METANIALECQENLSLDDLRDLIDQGMKLHKKQGNMIIPMVND